MVEEERWVDHTYQVLETVASTVSNLNAAESAARGFALTGRRDFSREFNYDVARVRDGFNQVSYLVRDNPEEVARLKELGPELDLRIATLQEGTRQRRKLGHPPPSDDRATDAHMENRARVLGVLNKVQQRERELLMERSDVASNRLDIARFSFMLMTILALSGLVGFYGLVSRLLIAQTRLGEVERDRAKELEVRVEERTSDLVAANRDLESFSYSVSHDLRAPLRAIGFFTRVLQEELKDLSKENLDLLNGIVAASGKMSDLIDALLKLSRVGRSELNEEVVDISALASQVLAEQTSGRSIDAAVEPGLSAVGDRELLTVLLSNLVSNAVKFTGNAASPLIRIGRRVTDRGSAFFVEDNGAGFDVRHSEKLFKPFERLHSEREFAGTGIGLAICERIVRRHGGTIWAEGTVGHGATFFFTLPPPEVVPRRNGKGHSNGLSVPAERS